MLGSSIHISISLGEILHKKSSQVNDLDG